MALEFESLPLKDFLNAFYKEYADFQAENKQELKDKLNPTNKTTSKTKTKTNPPLSQTPLHHFLNL